MPPTSRPACLRRAWALLPLLLGVACQHGPPGGALKMPPFGGLPLPSPGALEMRLPRSPGRQLDLARLDRTDFIPPGARRVGPRSDRRLALAPENRAKFPSTDLAYSPDRTCVLFHDGSQRSEFIIHWLMLLKPTMARPWGVFNTSTAFDTTWSADSQRFAVTNYSGDNSSEVFVEHIDELRRMPVDLRPLVEEFFPDHVISAPMFVKAYRWTKDGSLVVRGIGRAQAEPYDEFGCEALVSFWGPAADPKLEFLNGYVLEEKDQPPDAKDQGPAKN